MDFCPKCGAMILSGTVCHICNYDMDELCFERMKIGTPHKFISNSMDFKQNPIKLMKLIINFNKLDIKENDVLKFADKIIETANKNFIEYEKKIILRDFNTFLDTQNDFIDKSYIESKYYRNYFDYYSYFNFEDRIDNFNLNLRKQEIFNDFENQYISYSQMCEYKKDKNIPFDLESIVEEHNNNFIKQQMDNHQYYFDDIAGKSLDDMQRIAVLTDDDSTQIVAGAGTGKTLTIQAKVKYLIEKENVNPRDILCISFSNSARDDLAKKLKNTIGDKPVEVRTFHSLGYSILGQNDEYKEVPDYEFENLIDNYFKDLFVKKPELLKEIMEFFCYYFNVIYINENDLKLETIKSRLNRLDEYDEFLKEYLQVTNVKRKREKMNNIRDLIVANYLFIHNISYEYANPAILKNKYYDKYISKYCDYLFCDIYDEIPNYIKVEFINEFDNDFGCKKLDCYPSFFLPNEDIYVDITSTTYDWENSLDENEKKDIIDCLNERNKLNDNYKTKILTIFDHGNDVEGLLNELKDNLLDNNVFLEEVNYERLFDLLILQDNLLEYRSFLKTVDTFINLFKGNAKNIDYDGNDISEMMFDLYFDENNKKYSGAIEKRNDFYLKIIAKIYWKYKEYLNDSDFIDFNDMINDAVIKLRHGGVIHNYKYVIVDEYQDTSFTRYNLLKEIQNVTGAKVVVVGDDWQSIFGFTGCNVNLFSQFDKYFDYPKMVKINVTRRNSQKLIDVVGEFVQENHNQIPKKLLSEKKKNQKPIKIFNYNSRAEEVLALMNILNKISEKDSGAEVLIIGRNNKDIYEIYCREIFEITPFKDYTKIDYAFEPDLDIEFRTVHKSKGLQADYVVVLNLNNQINGFPNKIVNDPILDFVVDKEDENIDYPEERRLFYVALTRTKNDVYLFTKSSRPSYFITEIKNKDGVELLNYVFSNDEIILINRLLQKQFEVIETDNVCPQCGIGQINLILNNEKGTSYFRCSNFCGWNGGPYHNSDYSDNKRNIAYVKYSKVCPDCNHMLIVKKNPSDGSYFLGCNMFKRNDLTTWHTTMNLFDFEETDELYLNVFNVGKKEDLNKTRNGVYYLNEYIPKDKLDEYGGDERIDFSNQILDFKDDEGYSVLLLTKDMMKLISYLSNNVIDDNIHKLALIAVPPSKVKKIKKSSMRKSIDFINKTFKDGKLKTEYGCNKEIINFKDLIKRVKDVPTAHLGEGRASPEQHVDSMKCCGKDFLNENTAYIVLDDITTSGNTMKACNEILLEHGVNEKNIFNIALGATVRDDDEEI